MKHRRWRIAGNLVLLLYLFLIVMFAQMKYRRWRIAGNLAPCFCAASVMY